MKQVYLFFFPGGGVGYSRERETERCLKMNSSFGYSVLRSHVYNLLNSSYEMLSKLHFFT